MTMHSTQGNSSERQQLPVIAMSIDKEKDIDTDVVIEIDMD